MSKGIEQQSRDQGGLERASEQECCAHSLMHISSLYPLSLHEPAAQVCIATTNLH